MRAQARYLAIAAIGPVLALIFGVARLGGIAVAAVAAVEVPSGAGPRAVVIDLSLPESEGAKATAGGPSSPAGPLESWPGATLATTGDELKFTVRLDPGVLGPTGEVSVTAELRGDWALEPLWTEQRRIDPAATGSLDFTARLPDVEAACELRVIVGSVVSMATRIFPVVAPRELASASHTLLVSAPTPPPLLTGGFRLIEEIDPAGKSWWERSPVRRLAWSANDLPSHGDVKPVELGGARMQTLAPGRLGPGAAWQLVPLPEGLPFAPHLIEVETPPGADQALCLSVVAPDDSGRLAVVGTSLTVWQGTQPADAPRDASSVSRLFWPRPGQMLLVSNGSDNRPATFGKVRVSVANTTPRPNPKGAEEPTSRPQPCRLAAVDVSLETLPAQLGIAEGNSTQAGSAYLAARGLAELVELRGSNAAIVSLPGDMPDLARAELLAMVLREFDRRGLEVLVRIDADASNVDTNPLSGLGRQVDALAKRFGGHPSLAGFAVSPPSADLDPLPSDQSLVEALTAAGEEWPESVPRTPAGVAAVLAGPQREVWLRWRAEQVSQALAEAASAAQSSRSDRRLLVLLDPLLEGPLAERLQPRLGMTPTLEAVLLEVGVDMDGLARRPNCRLVAPLAREAGRTLPELGGSLQLDTIGRAIWNAPSRDTGLMILGHRSSYPIESLADARFLPGQIIDTVADSDGLDTRLGLARAIAASRCDVFVETSAGLSPEFDSGDRIARRLLCETTCDVGAEPIVVSPVTVQTHANPRGETVVLTNSSRWPVRATATLHFLESGSSSELLPGSPAPPPVSRVAVGQHAFDVELAPYQTRALATDVKSIKVVGLRVTPAERLETDLRARLEALRIRDLSARLPNAEVENPSFEAADAAGRPIAWSIETLGSGTADSVAQNALHGSRVMRVESRGVRTAALSRPFAAPPTRQLVVQFAVRAIQVEKGMSVVLAFEQVGGTYKRATTLPAESLSPEASGNGWQAFVFGVDDLPLSGAGPMRVRVECSGRGVIDFDGFQFTSLFFPIESFPETQAQRLQLVQLVQSAEVALEARRYDDCARILDGYWPRFMEAYVPKRAATVAVRPTPSAEASPPEGEEAPSLSERLRKWTPSLWR